MGRGSCPASDYWRRNALRYFLLTINATLRRLASPFVIVLMYFCYCYIWVCVCLCVCASACVCMCVIYVEPAESSRSTLLLCLLSRYFCLLFTFAASSPSSCAVARPCTSLHVDFMCVFPIGQSAKRAMWGKTWWMAAPLPHPTHSFTLHFTSITALRLLQHNCFFFFSLFSLFYWVFFWFFERCFVIFGSVPKVTVSKTMWMLLIAEKNFWILKYTTKIIKTILQKY